MGSLIDGTGLGLIDLPLIRYTIRPMAQVEIDAWPEWMNLLLKSESTVIGWEVWCESVDMRRSG